MKFLWKILDVVATTAIYLFFGAYLMVIAWGPIILIGFLVGMKPIEAACIVGMFSILGAVVIYAANE